jgi:hypothetical protein
MPIWSSHLKYVRWMQTVMHRYTTALEVPASNVAAVNSPEPVHHKTTLRRQTNEPAPSRA